MNRKLKRAMLTVAKHFFKEYPMSSIDITYNKIIPASGEIGCFVYDYKTFKFELNYALKNGVKIKELTFKRDKLV